MIVQIGNNETTTTVTLTNRSDEATSVQIRPYEWSQSSGDDVTTPTTQLVVSPPIFDLPPGQTQIVRIVRRVAATTVEKSYRLIVDELPGTAKDNQVRFALRISMPVFVDNEATSAKPKLEWKLRTTEAGTEVVATNRGLRRTRILNPVISTAQGTALDVKLPGNPYVLAGAERVWRLTSPPASLDLRLTADTDFGPITETIR